MSVRTQASAGSSATRSTATERSGASQHAASRLEELAAAHGSLALSGRHLPAFGLTIFLRHSLASGVALAIGSGHGGGFGGGHIEGFGGQFGLGHSGPGHFRLGAQFGHSPGASHNFGYDRFFFPHGHGFDAFFALGFPFYPYYPLYTPYPYYADPYCDPFIRPPGPQQLLLLHELPAVLDQAPRISDRGIAGAASIPPRSV